MKPSSASEPGRDVVVRVDRLADVVQQRGEQKLLVVGQLRRGPGRTPAGCDTGRPLRDDTWGSASRSPAAAAAIR